MVVFVSLFAFSAIRHPVPGRGEPYYLTKAKHYWNPQWCAGDFFLESSNPHRVFYQTVGLLTRVCSLPQTAWIGRGLALLLLASGWTALIRRLIPGKFAPVWAVWIYLGLAAAGNFSGEWIVGGVEAKVFAYGLVFWSWALLFDRSWKVAAVSAGLAVSFHPIVGLWSVAATLFAGASRWLFRKSRSTSDALCSSRSEVNRTDAIPRRSAGLISAVLFGLCTLPGLIPALALLGTAPSPTADYIEVYYRLAHHLDPMAFPQRALWVAGTLIGLWLLGIVLAARSKQSAQHQQREPRPTESTEATEATESTEATEPAEPAEPPTAPPTSDSYGRHCDFFHRVVVGSVLIAVVGLAAGFRQTPPQHMPLFTLRMTMLKFYPFRLADALLPIAVAVAAVSIGRGSRAWFRLVTLDRIVKLLAVGAMLFALLSEPIDRVPIGFTKERLTDWIETCRWVNENTPHDTEFLTPAVNNGFNWHAQRRQYVSFKDCPQDAPGIVEWNRRLQRLDRWRHDNPLPARSLAALHTLRHDTGATHLIVRSRRPINLKPLHENRSYRVYRLPR